MNIIERQEKKLTYIDQFKILKTLGTGFQASVYLVSDSDGKLFAIKRYKKQTSSIEVMRNQIKVLKDVKHENIINLYDARENSVYKAEDQSTSKCFTIILQFAAGGQLFDLVIQTGYFQQKLARTFFHQLINGLNYIHQKGYSHRDLKPENILIATDLTLKISDFGLACCLSGRDGSYQLHTRLGTEGYMAPEINMKNYDGIKVDIFSAGVILFIMMAATSPFKRTASNDQYYKLIRERRFNVFWKSHQRHKVPGFFSQKFRDLFVKMVDINPKERLSTKQILQHEWMKGQIYTQQQLKQQFQQRRRKKQQLHNHDRQKKIQQAQNVKNSNEMIQRAQSLSKQQQQFLEAYYQQNLKQRQLKQLLPQTQDDITINQTITYAITLIKQFFRCKKIYIQNFTEQTDLQNLQHLKGVQLKQQGNQLYLKYNLHYTIEELQMVEICQLRVEFGLNKEDDLLICFKHISGDRLWYKKIVVEIKHLFVYCIVS